MTKYDFTTQPNRLQEHSVKWQEVETCCDELPLWIADMDFLAVPEVRAAIKNFADYGVYGYSYTPDSFYQAIINWERKRQNYVIKKEDIVLVDGVVPAIALAIQAFTAKNDAVLINTPVYPPFAQSVTLNQRELVTNSLAKDEKGLFVIDFERLEADIIKHEVKLYILCSPHNPGGRVWGADELKKLGDLCQKHGVIVVADEIHQDLALFGNQHHSFNTVAPYFRDFAIVLTSATKTFNIAGTKCAYALIENEMLRARYLAAQARNSQGEISTLGLLATQAAYTFGLDWLEELKPVLEHNISYIVSELSAKTKIKVMPPQGTYLVWLDFSAYELSEKELCRKWHEEAKLILNRGGTFGVEGAQCARFNSAAPFAVIEEAVARLVRIFG